MEQAATCQSGLGSPDGEEDRWVSGPIRYGGFRGRGGLGQTGEKSGFGSLTRRWDEGPGTATVQWIGEHAVQGHHSCHPVGVPSPKEPPTADGQQLGVLGYCPWSPQLCDPKSD